MNQKMENLNEILYKKHLFAYNTIKKAKNILLLTHVRPDNDAVASMCVLIELLLSLNKNFLAFSKDMLPSNLLYLPHTEKICNDINKLKSFDFDLAVFTDCASIERTEILNEIFLEKKTIIEFDHHPKIKKSRGLEVRMPVSSTAEVLYDFLKINKIKINKNYANCILSGIIGDTDNFLHSNTGEKTILISSEMLIYGAQMPKINKNQWFNKSLESMKIWGLALSNLKINNKYNIAFSILENEKLKDISDDDDVFNAISNYFSSLYGVKGVMFLREIGDGIIKGSLRTNNPKIDISLLARKLGGGGHPKASGFALKGKIISENEKYTIV
jgi:bifunctional oligoribonuclease and PAP phosphatase NrnA